MTTFALNTLALRHLDRSSKYSHFEGTSEELIALLEANWGSRVPGPRPGVSLVSVPHDRFFSAVVELTPFTVLKAEFKERRKGEEKYLSVHALGREKVPALQVELVVYDRVTLGEDATSQADYEIVSVNARGTTGPEPMSPVAMMRNFLGLSGGTETVYTAEQFAEAIRYWSTHVMCGE